MSNYWSSSPYPHELAWPQTAYHATKDAKQVNSPAELQALGPEWSTNDAERKRDAAKTKSRLKAEPKEGEPTYETTIVADPEAEGKLEGGWSDTIPPATRQHTHTAAPP